jgi:hypothetical protein
MLLSTTSIEEKFALPTDIDLENLVQENIVASSGLRMTNMNAGRQGMPKA